MAKQTTKAKMTAELAKAITGKVEGYLGETPELTKEQIAKKIILEGVIKQYPKSTKLGLQATEELDRLLASKAEHGTHRSREIAEALVDVCDGLGLPLQIKGAAKPKKVRGPMKVPEPKSNAAKPRPKKAKGKATKTKTKKTKSARSRVTRDVMAERCKAVLAVLPAKSGKYVAKSDIAGMAGLTPGVTHNVLANLEREGKAEKNGERGPLSGWRKA